jgi:hypothetical protein
MASTFRVLARIDTQAKTVTFIPRDQRALKVPNTFDVEAGDTVVWLLQEVAGQPLTGLRLRFVSFPRQAGNHAPLFLHDGSATDTIALQGTSVQGVVNGAAPGGTYIYQLEPVAGPPPFRCFWADASGGTAVESISAGGQKSPPPSL